MSEYFITLQCPNCGGNLEIGRNISEYKCVHCGIEHIVKHGASGITLEAFARYPVCGRNDKAEKVSSILRSQVRETETFQYETKTTYKKIGRKVVPMEEKVAVPVKTTQASGLAKLLLPPQKPELLTLPNPKSLSTLANSWSISLIIAGILIFSILLLPGSLLLSYEESIGNVVFLMFTGLLIAAVLVGTGILIRKKASKEIKGN